MSELNVPRKPMFSGPVRLNFTRILGRLLIRLGFCRRVLVPFRLNRTGRLENLNPAPAFSIENLAQTATFGLIANLATFF
ncbi:unannotated protein [freshwater metagenome]|uniref:Unannotated protein n=1 Tax=freshwater metagenome TaxID=449393 RepID=A0A6J7DTB4_9ZZZZ